MAAYACGRVAFMIRAQAMPAAAATVKTAGKIQASAAPVPPLVRMAGDRVAALKAGGRPGQPGYGQDDDHDTASTTATR